MPNNEQAKTASQGAVGLIKRIAKFLMPAAFTVAAAVYMTSVSSMDVALQVSLNGAPIGYAEAESTVMAEREALLAEINDVSDGRYEAKLDISFDIVKTKDPVYISTEDCEEKLWEAVENDFFKGYMLYIDGNKVAAYTNKAVLEDLIRDIEYSLRASLTNDFEGVRISSDVRIEKQLCPNFMLKSIEEIDRAINPIAPASEPVAMAIEEELDDPTMRISAVSALTPEVSVAAYMDPAIDYGVNRSTAEETADFVLDYSFINTVTLTETFEYETKYVDDHTNFIGNEKIKSEGRNGVGKVTYELLYDENGTLTGRNAVKCEMITPVENRVILVGTKEIPEAVPTGTLIWPCDTPKGVSSYYGWRDLYGRADFHLGIDIPDKIGSPIWAADGGTVVFAGNTPSYGYNVQVIHSNGFSTLYAHLDTISVKVGDKVYQGQYVGTMGNTGVAYGTHLHFEVRIDHVTVDPMKYMP